MINIGKVEITKTKEIIIITIITTRIETITEPKEENTSKRSQSNKAKQLKNNLKRIAIMASQTCCQMIVIVDLLKYVYLVALKIILIEEIW